MNPRKRLLARTALSLSLALALAACGGSSDATDGARSAAPVVAAAEPASMDRDQLVDEIAANLQACSYDGAPVKVPARMGTPPSSDCRDMVAQIMRFTGLPQNFEVVEAPVPNAAAVILLDEQKLPHRVIAFNPDFINVVERETGGNAWAPVSIMAHEIGHHLSGHTIMPGGSQPPTELEADKFSGFVLYKMGATLDDAQKAMATFVPEGPDGPTHPGRGKRLSAISEGWEQACVQQGSGECKASAQGAPLTSPTPTVASRPSVAAPSDTPIAAPAVSQPTATAVASTQPAGAVDVLPAPGSTPAKFNQFVYDEFGLLEPGKRAEIEKAMFTLAKDTGVELVTLLVKDLHGMSAQDYAYAMLRQLRVGKLDVGNGAVMVAAPNQNDVAIAMGPGVLLEMNNYIELDTQRLRNFLDGGWEWCQKKNNCLDWTENFFGATEHIAHDTKSWEWTIRYQSLADVLTALEKAEAERDANGGDYEPETDPTWRKITRIKATVVDLTPDSDAVNPHHETLVGGKAMLVRADNGRDVMLYVNERIPGLMPGGPLVEGKSYAFVTRESSANSDTPAFDLLSYDLGP